MTFVVLFEDNETHLAKRQEHMAEHLAFLADYAGTVSDAGPLVNSESGAPAGGMWLVEADNAAAVRALVEADPFWPTGLRKTVRILAWKKVYADGRRC